VIEIDIEDVHIQDLIVLIVVIKNIIKKKGNKNILIVMAEDKEIKTDLKKKKANAKETVIADHIPPAIDEHSKNDLYTTTTIDS